MVEATILQKLIANDEDVFNQIYLTYAPAMVGFVHSITKDIEIAREITQDVFTSLQSAIKQYDYKKGSFKTWLFSLAKYKAINCIKRRSKIVCFDNLDRYKEENEKTNFTIDELIMILPLDEYQIINLRYIGKLKNKDIALVLEIPLSRVKRKLAIAHKKIRKYYEEN